MDLTKEFKILLDVPATNAALGFDAYAEALADIVQTSKPRFAVGIFGGWGSGKTTLMHAIRARLDANLTIAVDFSAWRYEREGNLLVPMLDVIREALLMWADQHAEQKVNAANAASTITAVIRSILAGSAITVGKKDLVEYSLDIGKASEHFEGRVKSQVPTLPDRSLYHSCFQALNQSMAWLDSLGKSRRIVVFVDDLDRCLPGPALEVIEVMKLFFDMEGFVFVVSLDDKVVEKFIEHKYAEFNSRTSTGASAVKGSEYIKKIFQVPFSLNPVSISDLGQLIQCAVLDGNLGASQSTEISTTVKAHLAYIFKTRVVNPRDVKRYINGYTLIRKIRPHLDPNVILAIQTLSTRPDWDKIYGALLSHRDDFFSVLGTPPQWDNLTGLDDDLYEVPGDFVEYVTTGPATALVQTRNISEYLLAGGAASDFVNQLYVDLAPRLARARAAVRRLADELNGANLQDLGQVTSGLQEIFGALSSPSFGARVAAHLSTLKSLSNEATESAGKVGNNEVFNVRDLKKRLTEQLKGLRDAVAEPSPAAA